MHHAQTFFVLHMILSGHYHWDKHINVFLTLRCCFSTSYEMNTVFFGINTEIGLFLIASYCTAKVCMKGAQCTLVEVGGV